MHWTEEHEKMLCREIIVNDLFQHKDMTRERGQCLDNIADTLNAVTTVFFKVDQRAIRDKLKKLLKEFIAKKNEEEKSSGISPEHSELDDLLQEIIDRKTECEKNYTEKASKKIDDEKAAAEDVRKRSMERLSETRKRLKSDTSDDDYVEKKRRSSGTDTIAYLREKSERDFQLREEEMRLKREELDQSKECDKAMFNMLAMNMTVMSKLADRLNNSSNQ